MLGKKLGRISTLVLSLILTFTMVPSAALANNSVAEQGQNISADSGKQVNTIVSNVSQLSQSDQISFTQNRMASTRSDNSDYGYYATGSGYLETEGSYKYLYPITVADNEVLQAQVDMPKSSDINYDVYLYEVDENGDMTLVDYSVFSTYINGSSGTVPEAVGVYNTSGESKTYALFVYASAGSSSTLPFTAHIGIDENTESAEPDENALDANKISFYSNTDKVISTRAMNTLCDNDWFYLDVTSATNFDTVTLSLDSASVSAGYSLEVFKVVGTGLKKISLSNGELDVSPVERYYIRVSSTGCSAFVGSDYTLTISPDFYADDVEIISVGDGDTAAYDGNTYYRVDGGSTVTVYGRAKGNGYNLPNSEVTIMIENPSWSADSQCFRSATVTTDSYGYFTANITIFEAYADYSTLVGSATTFRHYWDYGLVYGVDENGDCITIPQEIIYIFAYSTYVG